MNSSKQLGIWMDYSMAYLIELANDKIGKKTLKISPAFHGPLENLRLNESRMYNKAQNHQSNFYRELSLVINNYTEVLLFGPGEAKNELFNLLKNNQQLENVKISTQPADKLTENEQETFVKDFFKAHKEINGK